MRRYFTPEEFEELGDFDAADELRREEDLRYRDAEIERRRREAEEDKKRIKLKKK